MTDKDFIEKGSYTHPTPDGCIALKQYIITKEKGKRCLLLRFVNESAHTISAFEYVITELSSSGKVLGHSRITHTGIAVVSEGTYTPSSGIVVHNNCTDFRIRLVSYVSGAYKYVLKHGRAVAHYDPRGYLSDRGKPSKYNYVEVTPASYRAKRVFTLIAVIAVILTVFMTVSAKYRNSGKLPSDNNSNLDVEILDVKK